MTYKCPRCIQRGQTWNGDAPKCGFDVEGNFLRNNWNCATLNSLRKMGEETEVWCNNQFNMTIVRQYDVGHGILSWYKSHGATHDFRDGYFERGTLKYSQQLLGDIEPDSEFY